MDSNTGSGLGSLAGIGVSAATGNWIGAAMGAVGLGMQLFGSSQQSEIAAQQAKVSKDEAKQEQGINDLRLRQMELESKRSQIETTRNMQRARAMGISAAVNQGADKGSGLQGGIAQTQDQAGFNLLGIGQALDIGRGINGFNQKISEDKMQMADLGGQMSTAQATGSLGGAIMKAGPTVGQFAQGFGGSKPSNPYYGPLDYNG